MVGGGWNQPLCTRPPGDWAGQSSRELCRWPVLHEYLFETYIPVLGFLNSHYILPFEICFNWGSARSHRLGFIKQKSAGQHSGNTDSHNLLFHLGAGSSHISLLPNPSAVPVLCNTLIIGSLLIHPRQSKSHCVSARFIHSDLHQGS